MIYGEFATGKSQIVHHSCVSLYKQYHSTNEKVKSLFLDTEDTFRPKRIKQISESYGYRGSNVLKTVQVVKISSTKMMDLLLSKIANGEGKSSFGLLVVDSLTNYVRADFADEEKSSFSVKKSLKKIMELLKQIHETYSIPILLTSQVTPRRTSKIDTKFTVKPTMEYLINEYVDDTLFLYKGRRGERHALLFNSDDLAEDDVKFLITDDGIKDI